MSFNDSNDDLIEIRSDYSISLGSYEQMFRSQCLTDCVINCRDGHIKAHKLVLSVWSQYFRDTFVSSAHHCNQSVIFMKDIPFDHMRVLIELMYCGKACVNKQQLNAIRLSAESLNINHSLIDFIDNVYQTNDNRRASKRKRININDDDNDVCDVNQNIENVLNTCNDMIVDANEANDANNACETDVIVIKEELIEDENKTEEIGAESEPSNTNSRVKSGENKSHKVQSNEDTNNNKICSKIVAENDSPQSSTDVCNKASTDSNGKSKNKKLINKTVEKVENPKIRYSTRIQSKERNSSDKIATQSTQSNTNTSDDQTSQTSRFAQLSYQERQHHMKLQQIRYQALKGTQIKTEPLSDEEKSNDSQSNSEKLLVQLNPKDLLALCDSEESEYDFEGNDSAKKAETTTHTTTSSSNLVETKNKKEQSQSQYPSTSSSLATRLLINNNSLSNLLQSNVVSEPLILYNLVSSANWNASPMSAPSSIMYFPDSKSAQNKESNSASDPKLVPMWTNFVNTTETGTKAMLQQTSKTTKPNTSSHIPETSQQKKLSHEKDNKTVPKTVNSLLVRKKRNSCYQCNKCVKAYSSHQTLIDHIKIVHENSSENYACKICGKIVKWKDSLRGHFKTNHPDKDSTNMIEILK